jgi:predicted nucleotidyltransferase
MRINPKDTLFDYPILKIREIIRMAMKEELYSSQEDIKKQVSKFIGASEADGKNLLNILLDEKYLTINTQKVTDSVYWVITVTEKGRRLGVTWANPPITRAKADNLLQELLERVKEVNNHKEYLYKVESVKVFGSYLSDKEILGDLDVAIKVMPKAKGDSFIEWNHARAALALNKGRRFNNYVQQLDWARREVLIHLSTRKKGLSIHFEGDDDVLDKVQFKEVYGALS